MPGNSAQNWIMSMALVAYRHNSVLNFDNSLALDEMSVDFLSVAMLETPQFRSEHAVQRVGDHCQNYIEMHLNQYGRRHGVEIEKVDGLGNRILHTPASGVIPHKKFHWRVEIVGDQNSGLCPSVVFDHDLAKRPLIAIKGHDGLVDRWSGVLSLGMGNANPNPWFEALDAFEELFASPAKRDEHNALLVEFGQMLVGGEAGVEDECRFDSPIELLPKVHEIQYLLVCLRPLNIGGRVHDEFGLGILSEQCQRALHGSVSGAGPMFFENGFIAKMRNRMEIQIDDGLVVQSELVGPLDERLLKGLKAGIVQAIRIGGHGRAFGKNVQAGEEAEAGIESMFGGVGVSPGAEQLQSQKGQEVALGVDCTCSRKAGFLYDIPDIELFDKRREQERASSGTVEPNPFHLADFDSAGGFGNNGTGDGASDLDSGSSWQPGKAFFRQNSLDGSHRQLDSIFGQQLGDLSGGKVLLAPPFDFFPCFRVDAPALGFCFGDWLGKIDFTVDEHVSKEVDVIGGVSVPFGDDAGRKTFDERCPQSFVSPLPVKFWMEEEFFIVHNPYIGHDD